MGTPPSSTLNFQGSSASSNIPTLLNIDTSGNPSELAGSLVATGASVFIANANGIVVDGSANLFVPNGNLGLLGGTVSDDSAFSDIGQLTLTNGTNNNAPLTIDKGAAINADNVIYAGSGAVNMGDAEYGIFNNGAAIIVGGNGENGTILRSGTNGKFGFQTDQATSPQEDPTTVTIASGANIPSVVGLYSQGNIVMNGSVSAPYQSGNTNLNGTISIAGNNVQGSGSINANSVDFFNVMGDINNPNGGGNASNAWLPNHLTLNPLSATDGGDGIVIVQIPNDLTGGAPQMINLLVNGDGVFQVAQNTLQSNGAPASNVNSHLVMQSTEAMNLGGLNGTPPLYTAEENGLTNSTEFSFPGLVVAYAGSDGQTATSLNPQPLYVNTPIDNFTGSSTGNEGIFLEGSVIENYGGGNVQPMSLIVNPTYEWVNIEGSVGKGSAVNITGITGTGTPGNFQPISSPSNVVHYRAY